MKSDIMLQDASKPHLHFDKLPPWKINQIACCHFCLQCSYGETSTQRSEIMKTSSGSINHVGRSDTTEFSNSISHKINYSCLSPSPDAKYSQVNHTNCAWRRIFPLFSPKRQRHIVILVSTVVTETCKYYFSNYLHVIAA